MQVILGLESVNPHNSQVLGVDGGDWSCSDAGTGQGGTAGIVGAVMLPAADPLQDMELGDAIEASVTAGDGIGVSAGTARAPGGLHLGVTSGSGASVCEMGCMRVGAVPPVGIAVGVHAPGGGISQDAGTEIDGAEEVTPYLA